MLDVLSLHLQSHENDAQLQISEVCKTDFETVQNTVKYANSDVLMFGKLDKFDHSDSNSSWS